jgi:hypothetical protein
MTNSAILREDNGKYSALPICPICEKKVHIDENDKNAEEWAFSGHSDFGGEFVHIRCTTKDHTTEGSEYWNGTEMVYLEDELTEVDTDKKDPAETFAQIRTTMEERKNELRDVSFKHGLIESRDVDRYLTTTVHNFVKGEKTDTMELLAAIAVAQQMLRAATEHNSKLQHQVSQVFNNNREITLE